MITKEQYNEAQQLIKDYRNQQIKNAQQVAENLEREIQEHTKDLDWYVIPIITHQGDLTYEVTNDSYDEDYGGQFDGFIEGILSQKYGVKTYVTGIYGK